MEFGKVSSAELATLDFDLPPEDPRSWFRMKLQPSRPATLRVGVGCPVWSVRSWVGSVYPSPTDPKDYLFHYSRQFNSIELNTTHYRIPDSETVRRWRDSVPGDFRFNPKILQEVSHRRPLSSESPEFREFVRAILGLEDRLGLCFLQLPPTFSKSDLPQLSRFLSFLPRGFPLAVEARHPSLFSGQKLIDPLFDLLAKTGTHVVITDVAGRRDVLHSSLTTGRVLVRFIGNDLHPTDDSRMWQWARRLGSWIRSGLEQVEFFVHQPGDTATPEAVHRLIHALNLECGLNLRTWQPHSQAQLGLF